MKDQERIIALLESYINETSSMLEKEELFSLIDTGAYDDVLEAHILSTFQKVNVIKGADLSPNKAKQIASNILAQDKQRKQQTAKVISITWTRWAVAAAVIGIISLTVFLWSKNESDSFKAFIPQGVTETANNTDKVLQINMEDGSSISLQPGSVIHYPAHFSDDKREIYLEGEAFFQVSKNPARPFLVYNSHTVTRVLGTSFNIKEIKKADEVEVAVRTGKVQVYENTKLLPNQEEGAGKGVIITPNQKVTYNEKERQFESSLVDNPTLLTNDSVFVYDGEKLSSILAMLEKAYGIEIVADNENVNKCRFTGDITQQNLYSKLDIITQAIKASYKIEGMKILIKGKGCK